VNIPQDFLFGFSMPDILADSDIHFAKEARAAACVLPLEWKNIIPFEDGTVNQEAIEAYSKQIEDCVKRGLVVFAVLSRGALPEYLELSGGWCSRKTALQFGVYAEVCFEAFGSRVKNWITFQDINTHLNKRYMSTVRKREPERFYQASHNIFVAHARAVRTYSYLRQYGEIGIIHSFNPAISAENSFDELANAEHKNYTEGFWFFDPCLRGEYSDYMLEYLKKLNMTPRWSSEDLQEISDTAHLNHFAGVHFNVMEGLDPESNISKIEYGLNLLKMRYGQIKLYLFDGSISFNQLEGYIRRLLEQDIYLKGYFSPYRSTSAQHNLNVNEGNRISTP
jgi:6-phospho-beta-glucosidase